MTQAKDSNGHGDGEYKTEYEHVTEDVWYEVNPQGDRVDVAYTDDILDQMDEDDEDDDESNGRE